jgi:hypothetical protein
LNGKENLEVSEYKTTIADVTAPETVTGVTDSVTARVVPTAPQLFEDEEETKTALVR